MQFNLNRAAAIAGGDGSWSRSNIAAAVFVVMAPAAVIDLAKVTSIQTK